VDAAGLRHPGPEEGGGASDEERRPEEEAEQREAEDRDQRDGRGVHPLFLAPPLPMSGCGRLFLRSGWPEAPSAAPSGTVGDGAVPPRKWPRWRKSTAKGDTFSAHRC